MSAEPLMRQLRSTSEAETAWEETLIAVTEFLAFVLIAMAQGPKWAHQYILYVTDNMIVKDWLRARRPKHGHGRVLGRILTRLEANHKFVSTPLYARTYHNRTSDWLTRETEDAIQRGMHQAGYRELDQPVDWGAVLEAASRRQWLLPEDQSRLPPGAES